jgi:flagella synthesis protein FlgN
MQSQSPADSLKDEHNAATLLLQLLQQEQAHLINADVEGLSVLTEEKAKIVARMSELAIRRHKTLAVAGFEEREAGMQAWLKSRAATAAAAGLWTELLALAQSAKEMNRTNGLLIGQHMTRNQSALNVLQGTPQGGNFYGPNGQATTKTPTRSLVVG